MNSTSIELRLPPWIEAALPEAERVFPSPADRMRLTIELARQNLARGTGGPFGAGIFDRRTGALLAPGVNLVVPAGCSVLHAEMVAIILAQKKLGSYDLGGEGMPECELVTSTEPCAMCLGAVPWSGVRRLICGARDEDARRHGFDEGAKPERWEQALAERGIEVLRDVLREEAAEVLEEYMKSGGAIYNSRLGPVGD